LYTLVFYRHGEEILLADLCVPAAFAMLNIHGFFMIEKLLHHLEHENINEYYHHQLGFYQRQVQVWEEEMLKARKLSSNVSNHLYYLWDQMHENNRNEMPDCLEDLLRKEKWKSPDTVKSANVIVNALVNQTYSVAEKLQIDFQVHVSVSYKLLFHDEDICIMLGNALDHAIESAMETEPEKRCINFNMVASSNVLTLVIRNAYNRFTPEKKPDEKHNLGLSLIRKAAERYYGEVLIEKDENECSFTLFFHENRSILQNAIE
jgi:hypothetical protein